MLESGTTITTDMTRGYPKHKHFTVGTQVNSQDSFYVAFSSNVARLSYIGEHFPQVTHWFNIKTVEDLQPAVLRRQLLRFMPFRGKSQEGWDYKGYLMFVRSALGDKAPPQTCSEALVDFKVDPALGVRLDSLREELANGEATRDVVAVLALIFEVCVFVYDTERAAWEPDVIGALGAPVLNNVCYRRNVYVAKQKNNRFVALAPIAVFSNDAPDGWAEHTSVPEYGFWEDRERFLTMLHVIERAMIANRLGYYRAVKTGGSDEYYDTHSDMRLIKWSAAYSRALRERDLYPTERFYKYVAQRYAKLRSVFDPPALNDAPVTRETGRTT